MPIYSKMALSQFPGRYSRFGDVLDILMQVFKPFSSNDCLEVINVLRTSPNNNPSRLLLMIYLSTEVNA